MVFGAAATAQTSSGANQGAESQQLSEKSVNLITKFALTTIPSEIKQPDGSVLKIDIENVDKIVVPVDDARRIIMVARNSAHAQICDMPELQAENYLALMRMEQAKNKWSKEQMLFINRLHLFTVMWLTGNVQLVEKGDGEKPEVISTPKSTKVEECKPEDKDSVKANIEAFLKSVQKS
ncbi:MAG TPA: hypothetical protein VKA94_15360 [Hyphomicrobiales bacterium]|nr:hypothetical protein [Hyphomicrobiales bacterium]